MVVWFGLIKVTSVAAIASLVTMVLLIPAVALFGHLGWSLGWTCATSALIVYRHRGNIVRMIRGEERKVTA